MKLPSHVALPEGTPKWLEWLVGQTEAATKTRMAITMLVVLASSAFMLLFTLQSNDATVKAFQTKCPCDAYGGVCRVPLVNETTIMTVEGRVPYYPSTLKYNQTS